MAFTVLSVCTGNICRSPMCERLLHVRTRGAALDVVTVSAGTHGVTGYSMDAPSAAVLRELGGDPEGHVARRLTAGDVEGADLVLTATTDQRAAVVRLVPGAFRRAFTMREFGRLAAGLPPLERPDEPALRARVREVAERRGVVGPPQGRADDIGDPYGGTTDETRRAGRAVSDAVDAVVRTLGLSGER